VEMMFKKKTEGGKKKKGYKEKTIVTLETVIPEPPKKGELVPEPDETAHNAALDKISNDIIAIKAKMNDMIRDERKKLGLNNKQTESE